MNSLPIKAIIQLVKKYLDIEIPELREEKYYIQLLGMLKNVKTQNKSELNLLTLIFEKMFLKQNKFKSDIDEKDFNKFINLVNLKSFPIEEEENNRDYIVIKNALTNVKMINEKEIYLLYNLMNNEKSQFLFFKCFQEIISSKDKFFIENKDIELGNINYFTLLYYIGELFQLKEENNDEYYTFRLNNKGLSKGKPANEEVKNFVTTYKEIEKNQIIAFINKFKKLEKYIARERNNNNLNINMEAQQSKINPDNNDEKVFSNTKPNLEDEIMKLKKLYEDLNKERYKSNEKYDNIIKDIKEKHNKEIKDIKEKHNKDIKDIKEKHNKDIKDIKEKHNKDINDLIIKHNQDLYSEKKKSDERTDKKINNLNEKIKELNKTINDIKVKNNSLLNKNEIILKKNQILNEELTSHQIESKKNISNINQKLNNVEEEKKKYQLENTLIKLRDSSKYIIDFLYAVLYNKIDFTIKYETKVNIICEAIKKGACKNNTKFIEDLCKFLEKIYKDKVKGDRLTHDEEFKSHILDGNSDLNDFFTNYLEIQKYFNNFKYLYFPNNKNAEMVLKICKEINFFNSLNDFSQRFY